MPCNVKHLFISTSKQPPHIMLLPHTHLPLPPMHIKQYPKSCSFTSRDPSPTLPLHFPCPVTTPVRSPPLPLHLPCPFTSRALSSCSLPRAQGLLPAPPPCAALLTWRSSWPLVRKYNIGPWIEPFFQISRLGLLAKVP